MSSPAFFAFSSPALFVFCLIVIACSFTLSCARRPVTTLPFHSVRTLAGAAANGDSVQLGEPFGLAAMNDGTIYVSDGEAGRIWRVTPDGAMKVVAENLNTPSAIAASSDGTLVVADTGAHTIKRVEPESGRVTLIAGSENQAGFNEGNGAEARFNGPVGVTLAPDGTIYVADTYNDRIRAIDTAGRVRTIAGGDEPGYADAATGTEARFDTPCGIAFDPDDQALVVADTGNRRLRRVKPDGTVTTIAGTGEPGGADGPLAEASFVEPVGVTVTENGAIYVADAGASAVRVCEFGLWPRTWTLAGYAYPGLRDGPLESARLSRPSGVALAPGGALLVADAGNKLVRIVLREGGERGVELTPEAVEALRPKAAEFRRQAPPRWPYDPPEKPREIAATFGEIRGEVGNGEDVWFHNGLDIPGAYGETARIVRTEKILRPLAVEGVGGPRERIRFPTLGYVHLRVGRDSDDRAFDDGRFVLRRNERGKVTGVRVRRGAHFRAGEGLGTLNNQNHVHLVAGPAGSEFNALAALELPGVRDTVAPVIEKDGVRLLNREGRELSSVGGGKQGQREGEPVSVSGDVRIIVRAYDQMDGNAARRRLGLYQLGYQILNADGSPAPGFSEPRMTISFESLPDDVGAAPLAYAAGSKSGATGETVFAYIVTNVVRDREAAENFWDTSRLPAGDYVLRVFAADYFGNRTTRDVAVRVEMKRAGASPSS